jgi:hypothetical protein
MSPPHARIARIAVAGGLLYITLTPARHLVAGFSTEQSATTTAGNERPSGKANIV